MRTIVIGAGMAGLSAVHELNKAGADVLCLEQDSTPGGRVASIRKDGFIMDTGAQFLFKNYHTCLSLADELGLKNERARWPMRVGLAGKGEILTSFSANPRKILSGLKNIIRTLKEGTIPLKAQIQCMRILPVLARRRHDLDFIDFEKCLDLDQESLADFIIREGGHELLEYLFQSIVSCMTLDQPERVSAAYGLSLLSQAVGGLSSFHHGIGTLSERLAGHNAGSMRYNTQVDKIVIEDGRVRGVEVDGSLIEADAVIPAVSATRLLKLAPNLPDAIREPLGQAVYSACCHVIFALSQAVLPQGWYVLSTPRMLNSPVSCYTNNAVKSPYYAPAGGSQISCFTYDHYAREFNELPDAQIKRILIKDLQRFMPHMPDEPLFTEIRRWREAVCIAPKGMLSAMEKMKRTSYHEIKGLYLAGEYLHMPSVESAAKSGQDAARDALKYAG